MILSLFLIVLNVWGAEKYFDIPSRWTREVAPEDAQAYTVREGRCSAVKHLQETFISRSQTSEMVYLDTSDIRVWISMACASQEYLNPLFTLTISCKKCCRQLSGHILALPLNSSKGHLVMVEPKEDPNVVLEKFDTRNVHTPKIFCEYYAGQKDFTVRRFLWEYADFSRFFVSVQCSYAQANYAVIQWGKERAEGSRNKTHEKVFDFGLCRLRKCKKHSS